MGWRVVLTEHAQIDLRELIEFVARRNPDAAERLGSDLVARIFSLAEFPSAGAKVRDRPGVRKVCAGNTLIFYSQNDDDLLVEIVRIWDGRRDGSAVRL